MPSHYALAAATLSVYHDEIEKAERSWRVRAALEKNGPRILAYAQAHATLAVADALRVSNAEA